VSIELCRKGRSYGVYSICIPKMSHGDIARYNVLCSMFYVLCSMFYVLCSIFYVLFSIFYLLLNEGCGVVAGLRCWSGLRCGCWVRLRFGILPRSIPSGADFVLLSPSETDFALLNPPEADFALLSPPSVPVRFFCVLAFPSGFHFATAVS